MKLHILLFLNIIAAFTSCKGKTSKQEGQTDKQLFPILKYDTVKELANDIMVIYQDKKNVYWFGSWTNGAYRYDGKKIIHFTTKDGLAHNRTEEIKEDKSGNIFFSTTGGVCRFDGKKFNTLLPDDLFENDWKLEPDDLWFKCTKEPGYVYRYDGSLLHKLKFPARRPGDRFPANHPDTVYQKWSNDPYSIYTIYKDTKGNIWFGTAVMGVCRFNGQKIDWISENDVNELHNGPANGVRSIIEDKNGYFWFNSDYYYIINDSSNGKGFKNFYNRVKSIGSLDGKKNGILNEYLSVAKDNNNDLWFATYRNGVWKFNGNKIVHYPVQVNSKDITAFYIYKDNEGYIWLGTHENGAYKLNGNTFERFKL
jgi:ligand-binding sensor domain-containing protein